MLATSPHRKRRDLIAGLIREYEDPSSSEPSDRRIPIYWGQRKFTTSPWHWDRDLIEKRAAGFDNVFPKAFRARVSARVLTDTSINSDGEEERSYCVEVVLPRRCWVAATLEDVDYTAPVWLNLLALLFFAWNLPR